MTKQESLPVISGVGAGSEARALRTGRVALPAPPKPNARYLGARVGANCSYAVEFDVRRKAVAAAYYSFGRFLVVDTHPVQN
eukprot:6669625-Pyramimonas_sp.AAC.1